jgi:choline dehydrogenase-like flavoprotein
MDALKDQAALAGAVQMLQEKQAGPLTCISSCQGFFPYKKIVSPEELKKTVDSIRATKTKTDFEKQQLEQIARHLESDTSANLQLVVIPVSGDFDNGVSDQSVLFSKTVEPGTNYMSLVVLISYPVSRGSVHIRSAGSSPSPFPSTPKTSPQVARFILLTLSPFPPDVNDAPVIDPAYIKHPADVEVLAATMRFMDQLAHTEPLAECIAGRYYPSTATYDNVRDPDQARAAARSWMLGTYHPIGSCAMGVVTDAALRVKGVDGLRVVDASVFPNHVSGNICSSVYAVAEHAADIIKAENGHAVVGTAA